MVSMAAASLYLPVLPLTAGQILLNNVLSDVPAIGLADHSIDPELVDRPRPRDIRFIGRYMVQFGILSGALLVTILGITVLYVAAAEVQKKWFYRT